MDAGSVELLVMIGVNPVYDVPAGLQFTRRLEKVPTWVHLGLYEEDTATSASGTYRKHIRWKPGATFVLMTVHRRSCSP